MRIDGAAGDENSFDHRMRVILELIAIREGSRFTLVGVTANVYRVLRILRDKAPFYPGGKRGAAAPAQIRRLHFIYDLRRSHLEQGLAQRLVTAMPFVDFDSAQVRDIHPAGQNSFHGMAGSLAVTVPD